MKSSKRKRSSAKASAPLEVAPASVIESVAVEPMVSEIPETDVVALLEPAAAEPVVAQVAVAIDMPAEMPAELETSVLTSAHAHCVVKLIGSCTVREARDVKVKLLAALDASEPVKLDVQDVERIDAAMLQLLCAFIIDRKSRNRSVEWSPSSAAFSEAARLAGMLPVFGLAG